MRSAAWVWLTCLLAALGANAGTPTPQTLYFEPEGEVSCTVTGISERWSGTGFMPVRVRLENRAPRAREWEIVLTGQRGISRHEYSWREALALKAGETREAVFFLPGAGRDDTQSANFNAQIFGPGAPSGGSAVTLAQLRSDPSILTATHPSMEAALFAATNRAPGIRTEIVAVDPLLWPADWRVWSPFERVVLTADYHAMLDAPRRAALRDWVALGGVLDLYAAPAEGRPRVERIGHGAVRQHAETLRATEGGKVPVDLGERGFAALAKARGMEIDEARRRELKPEAGALGLTFFLLGFAVVVGPINLFVFAPPARRHRVFVTVPLISLAASALMAGYIVVKDGFGGEGARRGLVWLLPDTNQAVVDQAQVTRTGVLLGEEFALPGDVIFEQVLDQAAAHQMHQGQMQGGNYLRTRDGATGDWFMSRRRQEQFVRSITPTRARVELVAGGAGGESPVVQSSVGTVLRDFVYRDAGGGIWVADTVEPGRRVTLRPATDTRDRATPAGCFSAEGGAAEGLAPIETLASIRWDEAYFIYAGPLAGARTP
ncbi:MAG: hypothetical protein MUE42_00255 [Opitutaceae bacterium]|nr:hypothetical protein [Opitutaceae bacterium]